MESFDTFWQAYPRRVAKKDARKAWDAIRPDNSVLAAILAALEWQRVSPGWTKDGGLFVPYPATYLRGERWTDEAPAAATVSPHWQDACQHQPRCEDHRQHSWRSLKEESA